MDENLAKIRHERSKKDFPMLTLEDDEYVEYAFKRASVCLMLIMAGAGIGVIIILLGFLLVLLGQSMIDEMGKKFLFIMLFALFASVIVIRIVALKTYRGNRLFITNQRVIQLLITSLERYMTFVLFLTDHRSLMLREHLKYLIILPMQTTSMLHIRQSLFSLHLHPVHSQQYSLPDILQDALLRFQEHLSTM